MNGIIIRWWIQQKWKVFKDPAQTQELSIEVWILVFLKRNALMAGYYYPITITTGLILENRATCKGLVFCCS